MFFLTSCNIWQKNMALFVAKFWENSNNEHLSLSFCFPLGSSSLTFFVPMKTTRKIELYYILHFYVIYFFGQAPEIELLFKFNETNDRLYCKHKNFHARRFFQLRVHYKYKLWFWLDVYCNGESCLVLCLNEMAIYCF